jgi:hypothetical protein
VIQAGDIVYLKAGNPHVDKLMVEQVARGSDGTGGDGVGLYCVWVEGFDGIVRRGWFSESSVVLIPR